MMKKLANLKTYTTTIQKPRLVIEYDDYAQSPREWDSLGYFITIDKNYNSPDDHGDYMEIIKETGEEAKTQDEHIRMIKQEIETRLGDKALAVYPVVKHEHGGVIYRLGTTNGFDYSNNGFYIITEKTANNLGTEPKDFKRVVKSEIDIYNKYINGEVYSWTLYDEQGEQIDSGGGYYSFEDIKNQLPEEWADEDLSDYLI